MATTIRVLLVDDHAVLRTGLRALLEPEPDLEVVGEADSGEEALEKIRSLEPDIVVMDISMPGMGGLEATRRIAQLDDPPRVLVLTMHAEREFLMPVLEAGASGYVTKGRADEDLTEALRTVARGEVFLYPDAVNLLLRRYRDAGSDDGDDPLDRLSKRERQVLALTAEGFSATEAGEKLFISPKTVETHRSRVMDKLGLKHRSELIRFALRTGLLKAD